MSFHIVGSVQCFTDLSHSGFGAGHVTLEKGKTIGLVANHIAYVSHSWHKDMCEKCVLGSEFSPAAQHRAGA